MFFNSARKLHRKKRSPVLPVLLSFVFIIGASYAIAVIWQSLQDSRLTADAAEQTVIDVSKLVPEDASSVNQVIDTVEITREAGDLDSDIDEMANDNYNPADIDEPDVPEDSREPEINEEGSAASGRPQYPYALKATELVPASYFDDAIFFGDSISTGIPLYNVMPNAKVIAFTGIGTVNALESECIDAGDRRVTMLEAAKQYGEKKKVYIMLGGNGLGYDKETFIEGYAAFVDAVKEQYPKAYIYIQTMTPVTDYAYKTYPSVSNEIIEEYNLAIQDMAKSKGVYFLDVAFALMDSEGKLPAEASPVDGLHFTAEYYSKWFHYLRTHAVPDTK